MGNNTGKESVGTKLRETVTWLPDRASSGHFRSSMRTVSLLVAPHCSPAPPQILICPYPYTTHKLWKEVVSANGSSHNVSGILLFLWFSDSVSSQNLIPLQIVIYSINDCRFFDNSARNNIYLGTYTFCQQTVIVFNQPWTHYLSDYFYLHVRLK